MFNIVKMFKEKYKNQEIKIQNLENELLQKDKLISIYNKENINLKNSFNGLQNVHLNTIEMYNKKVKILELERDALKYRLNNATKNLVSSKRH